MSQHLIHISDQNEEAEMQKWEDVSLKAAKLYKEKCGAGYDLVKSYQELPKLPKGFAYATCKENAGVLQVHTSTETVLCVYWITNKLIRIDIDIDSE